MSATPPPHNSTDTKSERPKAGRDTGPLAITKRAHAHWRAGRRTDAIATLEQAIASDPLSGELHFQLGLLHAEDLQTETALYWLRAATELDPRHAAAFRYLGLAHAAAGRMPEAVDALLAAQRLVPRDTTIALELGMALRATNLKPADLLSRANVASNENSSRQIDAAAYLGRAFADDPELVETFLELPPAQQDEELFRILVASVRVALQQHPQYADLHYYAARLAERMGRLEDAAAEGERALALNPGYVRALAHLGQLYARLKRDDEAITLLEHAIEFGGDHPDVHFALGQLHGRAGRRHRAAAEFRRALDLNGNYTAAREALDAIAAA